MLNYTIPKAVQKFYYGPCCSAYRAMAKMQEYLDVEVPENFDEWSTEAQVNFLGNAMDTTQVADYLRESAGIESRGVPPFKKNEMIQMIIQLQE